MKKIESSTAQLFRKTRRELGWDLRQAAEKAGYENIDKGMRRMRELEDKGNFFPHPEIRSRFAEALGITEEQIEDAMRKGFQDLDKPIELHVIVRIMPAIYVEHDLPQGCSREDAGGIARPCGLSDSGTKSPLPYSWQRPDRCVQCPRKVSWAPSPDEPRPASPPDALFVRCML